MYEFSDQDIQQIHNHGLSLEAIKQQLQNFIDGFPYSNILSAATIDNGVLPMLSHDYAEYFDANRHDYNIVKFVPASGAATRMFKDLFEYLSTKEMNKTTQLVIDNLPNFAFYQDLMAILPQNATSYDVIEHLVTDRGLDYGNQPKALIQFHKYKDFNRTALEEHLVEGALYSESRGIVNIHFTVSPEHRTGFEKLLSEKLHEYETKFNVKYNISMSVQKTETDTIAVNLDNTPFRNKDGTLLFRPAGHGALIENLNDIEADIIFIKNIDNICPDCGRNDTVLHKKLLAGMAIKTQQEIFRHIRAIDSGAANLSDVREFIINTLGIRNLDISDISEMRKILNRPLRICGIIKNTGEPGGGPFWVRDEMGTESLQIVEPGQIAPDNISILKNGEFFSPTDIVCMTRDINGHAFNLSEYIDTNAGFISEKSKDGRKLRAMERPGLWNGAMARWNTIFVETPLSTFTPVKVIIDLLNQGHIQQ
ncbi:MAG: DUF4301 family protein [Alphaproteobacteria bacterium]|nr:DUF4301 family protein [Alphaproteobacteria bacterium]